MCKVRDRDLTLVIRTDNVESTCAGVRAAEVARRLVKRARGKCYGGGSTARAGRLYSIAISSNSPYV